MPTPNITPDQALAILTEAVAEFGALKQQAATVQTQLDAANAQIAKWNAPNSVTTAMSGIQTELNTLNGLLTNSVVIQAPAAAPDASATASSTDAPASSSSAAAPAPDASSSGGGAASGSASDSPAPASASS